MIYTDISYARNRLSGTIVEYKNKAIEILDIRGIGEVEGRLLRNNEDFSCPLGEFDLNPGRLGFVNYRNHCIYISRRAIRGIWRQGIVFGQNTEIRYLSSRPMRGPDRRSLYQPIENVYPLFETCLDHLSNGENIEMAFHRFFSVTNELKLVYKNQFTCGDINSDNGKVSIQPDKSYLKEQIMEIGLGIT